MLPELEKGKVYRQIDRGFTKGLWHRSGGREGTFYAGENTCGEYYPAIASRPPRRRWLNLSDGVQGMCCMDELYLACDGELMQALSENRVWVIGKLSTEKKVFGCLGNRMLILPDFKVYDAKEQQLQTKYVRLSLSNVLVQNQNYVDSDGTARTYKNNTLHCVDFNFLDYFSPGDSIRVSGTERNNGYYTIRAVEEYDLRFDENAFAAEDIESCKLTLDAPDLEGMCTSGDRLWGYAGNVIYASVPGDVTNWFRYDGDAESSYTVTVPDNGPFTGCVMHAGHPVFFKSNCMIEVYGSTPAGFSLVQTCLSGVMPGSGASLCSVGGDMLYLSENGVVRCSGSSAQVISEALGQRLRDGVATTDGRRYYLSAVGEDGVRALYVYDTVTDAWHREDGAGIGYLAYLKGDVYAYNSDNSVYVIGKDTTGHGTPLGSVSSKVEFVPLTDDARGQIVPLRLGVRVECMAGSELTLLVSYDGGPWESRATLKNEGSRIWYVPLQPRACDLLGVRVQGKGEYRILSLIKEYK